MLEESGRGEGKSRGLAKRPGRLCREGRNADSAPGLGRASGTALSFGSSLPPAHEACACAGQGAVTGTPPSQTGGSFGKARAPA